MDTDDFNPTDLEAFDATGKVFHRRLGKRIEALRKRAGLTQAAVAHLLGLAPQAIWSYELGERRIPADRLVQLAKLYRIGLDELVGVKLIGPDKLRLSPELLLLIDMARKMTRLDRRLVLRIAGALASQRDQSLDCSG